MIADQSCPLCSGQDCGPKECRTLPDWYVDRVTDHEGRSELFLDGPTYHFDEKRDYWWSAAGLRQQGEGPWRAEVVVRVAEYEHRFSIGEFDTWQEATERADGCASRVASEFGPELEAFIRERLAGLAGLSGR